MGAKRTKNTKLPPRMRQRGTRYYFDGFNEDGKRTDIPLGDDFATALAEWARLYGAKLPAAAILFSTAADRYSREVVPLKAPATQKDNGRELDQLLPVFGQCVLDSITTRDLATYRDLRKGKVRANRELALFSHIFNYAREWGYTDRENPCRGLRKNKERPRDRYLSDEELHALCEASPPVMQRVLTLAYATGQRPADVLKMRWTDIQRGEKSDVLVVVQNKTGARVPIRVIGRLLACVDECRRQEVRSITFLIADERGQRPTQNTLRRMFEAARDITKIDCQLRDVRAKAGSDKESLDEAQAMLGHSAQETTKRYRRRKGTEVDPM